ncbi:MAG: S8 family serine peptidase [Phycisphaeraceae bacterium]
MNRILVVLFALALTAVSPARAALFLDPQLSLIGMGDVWSDPRFADLAGAGRTIAVVDSGIQTDHFMFTRPDDEEASRVIDGANFAGDVAGTPDYADGHGHGTFVASVAAGSPIIYRYDSDPDTEFLLAGVAHQAQLASVRVFDSDGNAASWATIRAGLEWVVDNADDLDIGVVNMSLGSEATFASPEAFAESSLADNPDAAAIAALVGSLRSQGIAVVAASGNEEDDAGIAFPAILNDVFSVGATDLAGNLADLGNRSADLDLFAPGEEILGAALDGDLSLWDGTSFAAPFVSGAMILLQELYEQRTGDVADPDLLMGILQSTGEPVVEGDNTWHRLNVYAALDEVYAIPEPISAVVLGLPGMALLLLRRSSRQAA